MFQLLLFLHEYLSFSANKHSTKNHFKEKDQNTIFWLPLNLDLHGNLLSF